MNNNQPHGLTGNLLNTNGTPPQASAPPPGFDPGGNSGQSPYQNNNPNQSYYPPLNQAPAANQNPQKKQEGFLDQLRQAFLKRFDFNGKGAKIIPFALSMLLYLVALIALFRPLIRIGDSWGGVSISPFRFIFSENEHDLSWGGLQPLIASYWIARIFHTLFAGVLLLAVIATVHAFVDKRRNVLSSLTDYAMSIIVVFLLISMLIGLNIASIYSFLSSTTTAPSPSVRPGGIGTFIIGLLILILKFFANFIFKQPQHSAELEKSKLSMATAFILITLVISTLFVPLYIFPSSIADLVTYRLNGLDLLTGGYDVLWFLPASGVYGFFIVSFIVASFICFIINLFLYMSSKRIFVQFNKFFVFLGVTTLVIYMLIGINYLIAYIDAAGFGRFVFFNWSTYSFVPFVLFLVFCIGTLIARLVNTKQHIEYKVYARPERKKPEPNAAGAGGAGGVSPDEFDFDPIPVFSEIDNKKAEFEAGLAAKMPSVFNGLTLPSLISHIIEYAKYSEQSLSYSVREIKTFVAGIAASRLSILQGMSGTGKTSLPKIFMEAIDGYAEMIAVESSWRDKNELIGYYNEFNKKFTPKTFTQALYKASLNPETPVFIVLDEMNLSRVEYYFSDFLSLMEANEKSRRIKLFDVQLYPETDEREDYLSLKDGHTLDIPPNVWFIGTANRDESTFEISDKVYDRAQTMIFGSRAPKPVLNAGTVHPKRFVTYDQLKTLFDECKNISFDAEGYETVKKVEALLAPYKISFGNRVLKQIESFVKAYVSCSEMRNKSDFSHFAHEAVDCILFSKVVRKLEYKQINDIEDLIDAFSALKLPICEAFIRSLQV